MAVFRVEKNRNYTVMSNVHLKDRGISLKAKGLLSVILSLPEDWNYTTRGLAAICKEGVDSIGAALRELESAGYLIRHRLRDKGGRSRIRSISSMRARTRRRKRIHHIRLHHVRKTRIWFPRIRQHRKRMHRIRKTLRN